MNIPTYIDEHLKHQARLLIDFLVSGFTSVRRGTTASRQPQRLRFDRISLNTILFEKGMSADTER